MGTTIFNKEFAEKMACNNLENYVTAAGWERLNKYKMTGEVEFQGNVISFAEFQIFLGIEFGWKDGKNISKFWTTAKKYVRNLNDYQKETIDDYFDKTKAPLYIDQEEFQKRLLLSSRLLFSENEKICLCIMVDRMHIGKWWTAEEIIEECRKYGNTSKLRIEKIEECLNRHCRETGKEQDLVLYEREELENGEEKTCHYRYKLRLSDLILYNNNARF